MSDTTGEKIKQLADTYCNISLLRGAKSEARRGLHEAVDDLERLFVTANEQHEIAGKLQQESVQREIILADENERLRRVIANIQTALDDANCMPGGPISDTIWYSPSETLFDYITAELKRESAGVGMANDRREVSTPRDAAMDAWNADRGTEAEAITDEVLIEKLKDKFSIRSDRQIAIMLGIAPQDFSSWRKGKRPLPLVTKFEAWDKLGYAFTRNAVFNLIDGRKTWRD